MDNFLEIASVIKEIGGGIQINNETEFIIKAKELLKNNERFKESGEKAYKAIEENHGSVLKSLEILDRFI